MKKIGQITPYFFDGCLIFSLDREWEKFLFPKIFDVFIDRQRHLTLRSLKKIREEYDALQRS